MRGVSIDDLLGYRFLSHVRFAPDGGTVAFLVKAANRERNAYDADIYLTDLAKGSTLRLTTSGRVGAFAWSL